MWAQLVWDRKIATHEEQEQETGVPHFWRKFKVGKCVNGNSPLSTVNKCTWSPYMFCSCQCINVTMPFSTTLCRFQSERVSSWFVSLVMWKASSGKRQYFFFWLMWHQKGDTTRPITTSTDSRGSAEETDCTGFAGAHILFLRMAYFSPKSQIIPYISKSIFLCSNTHSTVQLIIIIHQWVCKYLCAIYQLPLLTFGVKEVKMCTICKIQGKQTGSSSLMIFSKMGQFPDLPATKQVKNTCMWKLKETYILRPEKKREVSETQNHCVSSSPPFCFAMLRWRCPAGLPEGSEELYLQDFCERSESLIRAILLVMLQKMENTKENSCVTQGWTHAHTHTHTTSAGRKLEDSTRKPDSCHQTFFATLHAWPAIQGAMSSSARTRTHWSFCVRYRPNKKRFVNGCLIPYFLLSSRFD